jgi:hypothetical protein
MRRVKNRLAWAALGAAMLSWPAFAQTAVPDEAARLAAIEADVDANGSETSALAKARALAASNDLSAAASSLEAFLIADEKAQAARAEYAVILCRLDDLAAGKFEGAKLISTKAAPALVAAVTAACGALPDPAKLALGEELPQ